MLRENLKLASYDKKYNMSQKAWVIDGYRCIARNLTQSPVSMISSWYSTMCYIVACQAHPALETLPCWHATRHSYKPGAEPWWSFCEIRPYWCPTQVGGSCTFSHFGSQWGIFMNFHEITDVKMTHFSWTILFMKKTHMLWKHPTSLHSLQLYYRVDFWNNHALKHFMTSWPWPLTYDLDL